MQPVYPGFVHFQVLHAAQKYRFEKKLSNRYNFSGVSFFKCHQTSDLNTQLKYGTRFE